MQKPAYQEVILMTEENLKKVNTSVFTQACVDEMRQGKPFEARMTQYDPDEKVYFGISWDEWQLEVDAIVVFGSDDHLNTWHFDREKAEKEFTRILPPKEMLDERAKALQEIREDRFQKLQLLLAAVEKSGLKEQLDDES